VRRARYLPPNKRVTCPTRAVWVDTETRSTEESPGINRHDLWFGWAAYGRRHRETQWSDPDWHRFTDPEGFWTWCVSHVPRATALYVFAHNAAYDMTVTRVWDILPDWGWDLTGAVLESPPFLTTWRKDRHVIKVVDTLNLWRKPLAVLGDVVGVPKLDMPDLEAPREDWDRYCRRDVTVLREMCLRWWQWLRDEDLGSAAVTLASQAFTTYRHRYLTHPVFIDNNRGALRLSRDAYSGGRTECFRLGEIPPPVHVLDVNSLYPSVMRDEVYPSKLVTHMKHVTRAELSRWVKRYAVTARVTLTTDEPCYPLRVPGYLLHPVGTFTASLCTPELLHALTRDRIRRVHEVAVYETAPVFRAYVEDFWDRRRAAQRAGDTFADEVTKLMLNSLYGKLAQRGWKTEIREAVPWTGVGAWTEIDADTGKVHRVRALGGVLVVETQQGESRYSHPAIAAHVTAYGRLRLWDLIQTAGRDHVYYCDTDSVFTDDVGLARLSATLGPGLGQLKRVQSYADPITIYGNKDYAGTGLFKCKGVRRRAVWTSPNTVEQELWVGIKGMIQRGQTDAPRVRLQTKQLRRVYHKGRVLPDGGTAPWCLPDDDGRWGGL
jgi:hypothetical protein